TPDAASGWPGQHPSGSVYTRLIRARCGLLPTGARYAARHHHPLRQRHALVSLVDDAADHPAVLQTDRSDKRGRALARRQLRALAYFNRPCGADTGDTAYRLGIESARTSPDTPRAHCTL